MFDIDTKDKFMSEEEHKRYIQNYYQKRNWSSDQYNQYIMEIEKLSYKRELTKEKLETLKKYFNLSTDYWLYLQSVNCYAYALGIDLPPDVFNISIWKSYQPGCFYEAMYHIKLEEREDNLLDRIKLDFKVLGITYKEVSSSSIISPDEWKIAYLSRDVGGLLNDYHFLRQGSDGTWYHKSGHQFDYPPTNKDDNGNIIYNPEEAIFINEFKSSKNNKKYKFEKCYSLRYL